jgi:pyruvate/2-oxoglutarate dehydrogenase complex dihydrolipoamide dehydrogenase (E3) component
VGYDYDLIAIGSCPAGQKAAIQAAKLGKRVGLIERGSMMGGVCVNTGTIPSKTLREAVLYLTGMTQRGIYGQSYRVKEQISAHDLFWRMTHVIQREMDVVATSWRATTSRSCRVRHPSSIRTRSPSSASEASAWSSPPPAF